MIPSYVSTVNIRLDSTFLAPTSCNNIPVLPISYILSLGSRMVSAFSFDPLLTQNAKKAGRPRWKQRKIRRTNGGKKGKSEPKQLQFARETTYGPEGRGFESLTAYQSLPKSFDFGRLCFLKVVFSQSALFLTHALTPTGADSGKVYTALERIFPIVCAALSWASVVTWA